MNTLPDLKIKPIQEPGKLPWDQLEIPNQEVRELYQKTIFEWLLETGDETAFTIFIKALQQIGSQQYSALLSQHQIKSYLKKGKLLTSNLFLANNLLVF